MRNLSFPPPTLGSETARSAPLFLPAYDRVFGTLWDEHVRARWIVVDTLAFWGQCLMNNLSLNRYLVIYSVTFDVPLVA
jgi:hypothetical protein